MEASRDNDVAVVYDEVLEFFWGVWVPWMKE